MSTLTGKTVADTYVNLLQLNSNNQGVDGSIKVVETGNGVESAIGLSTTNLQVRGDVIPSAHDSINLGAENNGFNTIYIGGLTLSQADVQEVKDTIGGKYALASQGATADSAVQRGENINWSLITSTPTTLAGYGITDSATSAQGAVADSALQPGTVSFTTDIVNKPTTLTGYGITDAATSDQGIRADTALQPGEAATPAQGTKADNAVQRNGNETLNNLTITGNILGPATLTIDPATHGDISGKVVILGDLQVDGTTTTVNSITVTTADKQIILSEGSTSAAASDGSGVVVQGANANLLYVSTTDTWEANKPFSNLIVGESSTNKAIKIYSDNTTAGFEGGIYYEPRDVPTNQIGETIEFISHFKNKYDMNNGSVVGTTRHIVAIEDGLRVGNTSTDNNFKLSVTGNSHYVGSIEIDTADINDTLMSFRYNNVQVGSIARNQTSTSFLTTSDYRLKTNLVPLSDATTRISQIPVYQFNFKSDQQTVVDGFLAHEVQQVVPEAVQGEKDQVNDSGEPIYQGIDQSKLVPLLVAAVKEQQAVIENLKSRIESLESN